MSAEQPSLESQSPRHVVPVPLEPGAFRGPLIDAYGRRITSLRVSLIDVCNLRCSYCMPASGMRWMQRGDRLTSEEIAFAVTIARSFGIDHIRLTGGEPLLHPEVLRIVRTLKHDVGVGDLSLTTNGVGLAGFASALKAAGLDRLNVSMDTLDAERFRELTRRDALGDVWAGVDAALEAGLSPLRINVLLIRGFNEDEVERWLAVTREKPLDVRFLEVMPIGAAGDASRVERVDVAAVRDALVARHGLVPAEPEVGNGPAAYWRAPGAPGMLGFITPLSDPYCNTCSRFRLTAGGGVRPCLAQDHEVGLRDAIRARDVDGVVEGFRRAAAEKIRGHRWNEGDTTRTIMSTLGG